MRCVLVGNYGVQNFGDEALRSYFERSYPEVEWVVLSASPNKPNEYPRLPSGLKSFVSLRWIRTFFVLRSCQGMVFGSGTLFTDVESPKACFLWWIHLMAARIWGIPVALAFQGIGPFRTEVGEWLARSACKNAGFISVRDEESLSRVSSWDLNTKVIHTFDPFILNILDANRDGSNKLFIIIPRKNSSKEFFRRVEVLRDQWADAVRILSFQPDHPAEQRVLTALVDRFPETSVFPIRTSQDLLNGLTGAAFVLTQRYHGALAALSLGIPYEVVTQEMGDKLSAVQNARREMCFTLAQRGETALREWFATLEE